VAAEHLLVELNDRVLTLTINRPEKRNALSMTLLDELGETLAAHATQPDLKCAVITATGDQCFAAGGDLAELDAIRSHADAEAMSKRGRQTLDRIRSFPLPVIAGLNGLALGGGAELAMACDFRVAVPSVEIAFLQAQLNVTTAWGGGIDLIAAVGGQRALDLLLTSRRLTARDAAALGLIDRVCDSEQSLSGCLNDFLKPYLKRSSNVLRGFKALTASYRQSVHERLAGTEEMHFATTWSHPDHWTAVEQIQAKRTSKKTNS